MSPLLNSFDLIVIATCLLAPLCQNVYAVGTATREESLAQAPDDEGDGVAAAIDEEALHLDKVIPNKANREMNVSIVASAKTPLDGLVGSSSATPMTPTTTSLTEEAMTTSNGTIPSGYGTDILQNRGMIARMTYVLVGFSILILVYFVVKAVRLRRVKSRTRKYGVLTENLDSPLGLDESDEEVEVFEVNGTNLRGGRNPKGGNTASDRLLP